MFLAVVVPAEERPVPPPLIVPGELREDLTRHVACLLEYVIHADRPLAGVAAGYLVECAQILGRLTAVTLTLTPIA